MSVSSTISVLSIALFLICPKFVRLNDEQQFDLVGNGWSFVSESNATLQVFTLIIILIIKLFKSIF